MEQLPRIVFITYLHTHAPTHSTTHTHAHTHTQDIQQISDTVMQSLLVMFQSHSGQSGGGVQEDAIMTVGVLVEGEYNNDNLTTPPPHPHTTPHSHWGGVRSLHGSL